MHFKETAHESFKVRRSVHDIYGFVIVMYAVKSRAKPISLQDWQLLGHRIQPLMEGIMPD